MNTGEIYTIIKWGPGRHGNWFGEIEYRYHSIVCSFSTRKGALSYIKSIGCEYKKGRYVKGDYLYTVKKTNLMN